MNSETWDTLVDEEIVDEINQLRGIEVGTEQYKVTVDGLVKLLDRSIEKEKFEVERKKADEAREFEKQMRLKQMKDEQIDRLVKNILTGISIGGGILLTIWGTNKTLKFEETGTVTTTAGRKFTGKLFSWLK